MKAAAFSACALLALASGIGPALAQNIPDPSDWSEAEVPPPPAFDVKRLLALPVQPGSSLRAGVDPQTLSIGKDGVVRYVFLAPSSEGALNASYEGIRCSSAEFRRYARWQPESQRWERLPGGAGAGASSAGGNEPGDWQPMRTPGGRYAWLLARAGLCREGAANTPVGQIVHDLRTPPLTASP